MGKNPHLLGTSVVLMVFVFAVGCSDMNRKHFSKLEPTKVDSNNQYFQYKASTGARVLKCAPGSKNCKVENADRPPIWPLQDKEAEKTRLEWLDKSLAEQGYQPGEYEILSRQPILTSSIYDVAYDVKVTMPR